MKHLLLASIAVFACLVPPVGMLDGKAQEAERCHAYDPDPRCTAEQRDLWRSMFGLPSLEAIHRRHGTSRDLIVAMVRIKTGARLAIVFHANRNGTATAEVYRRPRDETRLQQRQPLRVTIPGQVWRDIVARGAELPDVFAREDVYVCGATFMIEFRDAAGRVRSPVGDACGDEPRGAYFDSLAKAIVAELPRCRMRELGQWETSLDLLEECGLL